MHRTYYRCCCHCGLRFTETEFNALHLTCPTDPRNK